MFDFVKNYFTNLKCLREAFKKLSMLGIHPNLSYPPPSTIWEFLLLALQTKMFSLYFEMSWIVKSTEDKRLYSFYF